LKTWLKTTGTCAIATDERAARRPIATIASVLESFKVIDGHVVEPLAEFIGDRLVRLLPTAQDDGDLSRRRRGPDHRRLGLGFGFRYFDHRLRHFNDFGYRLDRLRLRREQRTAVQQKAGSVHRVPLQFLTSGRRQQACPGYSLAFTGFVKRVLCAAS
jgi:hypothetical protein